MPERRPVRNYVIPSVDDVLHGERQWLEDALQLLQGDKEYDDKTLLTWSAHHSAQQRSSIETTPGIGVLLPLFQEKAATISMIKHGIAVLQSITEYLNPEQVHVIACDQPMFALVKYFQWAWPTAYGEDRLIPMLGGLTWR